ncbi:MAG: hypothetical protein ACI845_000946 [Gammaproteobacteria bacterium]|jgi:hypothetical protein
MTIGDITTIAYVCENFLFPDSLGEPVPVYSPLSE